MKTKSRQAVLLMAFGAPERPEDIRPFLKEIMRDRPVSEERIEEAARRYEEIGGISPLPAAVRRQAADLEAELARSGRQTPVRVGMCHWSPFIRESLEEMAAAGIARVAGIVLAPHGNESLLNRYRGAVMAGLSHLGSRAPAVVFCPGWHDRPRFIDALAARVREAISSLPEQARSHAAWMFSAHSLPAAAPGTQAYLRDLRATGDLLAARFGNHAWQLVFQSAGGRGSWLGPDVNEAIEREAKRGERAVLVVPVGFAAENVELVYDLDRQAAQTAATAGIIFSRARAACGHAALTAELADAALDILGGK